jgi:ABC-type branched-subunit amino acid transport system ATPase component
VQVEIKISRFVNGMNGLGKSTEMNTLHQISTITASNGFTSFTILSNLIEFIKVSL